MAAVRADVHTQHNGGVAPDNGAVVCRKAENTHLFVCVCVCMYGYLRRRHTNGFIVSEFSRASQD